MKELGANRQVSSLPGKSPGAYSQSALLAGNARGRSHLAVLDLVAEPVEARSTLRAD
ncbi:MAG: hypothetical protein WC837_14880 [Bellilinea sp.]